MFKTTESSKMLTQIAIKVNNDEVVSSVSDLKPNLSKSQKYQKNH